ncbi:MAG: magnesium/cobalt transporter CorA [Planctomycetota bacterium]|jgi:magnesium transporter
MAAAKRRRDHQVQVATTPRRPGTAPGTLVIDPDAPAPRITVIAYGPDDLVRKTVATAAEAAACREQWPVVWVDVTGLGDPEVLTGFAHAFGIHRLALEDVVHVHQQAKVEPYDEHLFVVARMVRPETLPDTEQVSMFVGSGYVLTFQERAGDCFDLVRQRLEAGRARIRGSDASYLAYTLLDAIVDAWFPVLDRYGERLQALEDDVLAHADDATSGDIHAVKRELLAVRRAVWPQREMLNVLLRDESSFIADGTRVYLRDCYDHALRVIDIVESCRELAAGLRDLHMASVGNRLNEIMKVLTIFAAIFIPLSFIAGLYGMNFDTAHPWNMPETGWAFGYPLALATMAAVAAGLLLLFRRRGWIGSGPARRRGDGEP